MAEKNGRRDRGTGSLFPRGTIWWLKYYRNGRPYRESSHSGERRNAERLLKRRLAEIETNQFHGLRVERVRFDELASDLENDYAINHHKSAVRNSRSIGHLRQFFGGWRALETTTDRIREYIVKRQSEGAANATINRELAALKRMFNLARQMTPPKVAQVPHIPTLKEAPPRKGFLEKQGFLKLRNALPDYLKPLLALLYYTGMRVGEALWLRWEQVSLQDRQVRLDPGTTKNDDARTIPLTGELYQWLKMQKEIQDARYPDCPWVFFRKGKRIKNFYKAWRKACIQVGLGRMEPREEGQPKYVGLIPHDLRRSGVRNLIRAGVPERVAMTISGHRTRSVFDRYNIVNERDLRDAARKLEQYLTREHRRDDLALSKKVLAKQAGPTRHLN